MNDENVFRPVREVDLPEEFGGPTQEELNKKMAARDSIRHRQPVHLTLHREELEMLDKISKKRDMSKSFTVGQLIREYALKHP